jgi:hypothetical protein
MPGLLHYYLDGFNFRVSFSSWKGEDQIKALCLMRTQTCTVDNIICDYKTLHHALQFIKVPTYVYCNYRLLQPRKIEHLKYWGIKFIPKCPTMNHDMFLETGNKKIKETSQEAIQECQPIIAYNIRPLQSWFGNLPITLWISLLVRT